MTKFSLLSQSWQLKLVGSVAIVGTLFTAVGESVLAQIVPDNTLGAEGSVVTPNVNIQGILSDRIDGGATRDANFFHSFQEFNVGEGRGAYFANPIGIENILTRVTGGNPSNILGRLGVLGGANLLLLNPNGIVFGQNASLDVQGSFFATTADGVRLGDTGLFSASEPATSNLLTVNPSAFLFNAIAAQPIINQSIAASVIGQPNSLGGSPGLQVRAGQTLGLIGGDVRLEGGNLTAAGGRIELGSVAGVGEVSLSQTGAQFLLGYDSVSGFGNILLSNAAFVDASGEGGGDVQIRGAWLEMNQGSFIFADTWGTKNGGEVLVKTTDEVVLSEGSLLTADVFGSGTGGDLTIETGKLTVQDGSRVSASTFGSGDTGDLRINTGRLLVRDGAQVLASTRGEGKGGNLQITASDSVELIGGDLFTESFESGDAGDLRIDTRRLLVRDGAMVSASTRGEGKGGNLQITASDSVELIGTSADSQLTSGLFAATQGTGDAGDLMIDTSRLLVQGGAVVSASTERAGKGGRLQVRATDAIELIGTSADGKSPSSLAAQAQETGDAGDLMIDTSRLLIQGGAQMSATTFGEGKGGSLQVRATDVIELIGRTADGKFPSGLFAATQGTGDAGDLMIDTSRLLVRGGAQVSAATLSAGKGGSLQVRATDAIELIGRSADDRFSSGLFAQAGSGSTGDAGELIINTSRLLVRDGAQVLSGTFGEGKGGNLQVTATDAIELIGTSANLLIPSGLFAGTRRTGNAGNLIIDTSRLLVRDGAQISSESLGRGNASSIIITVRDTLQANDGLIATSADQSTGGVITITAKHIRLFGDSDITSRVGSGAGNGGNVNLSADSIVALDDSDILAFARDGQGGNVTLDTPAFFGQNYRPAPKGTDPAPLDNNDRVDINATGAVEGVITITSDTSFIQNSLTELPDNQINTDRLLANSCIVRRNEPTRGTFFITGTGGLPQRPGDAQMSTFPTVDIETLPSDGTPTNTNPNRPWQKGDPIVEPQGVYRLPNGKLVLSRECP